jgi:F0F1-type ATP synthase assembly protein I
MSLNSGINDIGPVIQLSVAPVFLLTAIGALIGVHTGRLARAVDRTRILEERQAKEPQDAAPPVIDELEVLRRRMRLIYVSIALDVISALLVGLTIVTAFIDAFLETNLSRLIALLFVGAMFAFIASLAIFLREIFLAVTGACGTVVWRRAGH